MRSAIVAAGVGCLALGGTIAAAPDPLLEGGFKAMYALDFASADQQFADYVRERPDDALGYASQAVCVLFRELDRIRVLDAEFYLDDERLLAEPKIPPEPEVKQRLLELTATGRRLADVVLGRDGASQEALFALSLVNGLEADYIFLVEGKRLAAARPGRAGYEYAKRLLKVNPEFGDAYIWIGVTNYVVASLPFPLRWLAKLRGYPGSKEAAIKNLRLAAEKGQLLGPYAKILLVVTFLREKQRPAAQAVLAELSSEFPANPLFAKHAKRLAMP